MKKKLALMFTAMLLVCVIAVGATIAYLTSTPDPVINTFTVGKVGITLDESDVDEYGSPIPSASPTNGNTYKLIPGHSYVKNPTIHVSGDSEESYLFVKVENGLEAIEKSDTIAKQMVDLGWVKMDDAENIWYLNRTVNANENIPVFNELNISETADVENYEDAQILVASCAIQAYGFANAQEAFDTACPAKFYVKPINH